MSRKAPTTAFASAGKFDILAVEGDDYEEEEEQVVEEAPSQSTLEPATLSKAAKKRARQAAKLAESAVKTVTTEAQGAAKEVEKVVSNGGANGTSEASPIAKAAAPVVQAAAPVVEAVASALPSSSSGPSAKKASVPSSNGVASSSKPAAPTPAKVEEKLPVPHSPPQSSFKPQLPDNLPEPSSTALSANRKRKTPQDFTPAGPRDTPSASSPSKISVKFEDGVSPGEGADGEKTIPVTKAAVQAVVPRKNQNMVERTVWTFIMIGGFVSLLCLGHPYVILLVLVCQALVYKEVTALFDLRDEGSKKIADSEDPWSKTLNWYFFVVTNYFLYGESIIYYFKHIVFVDAYFIPFAMNHRFISFMLYVVGFVSFVANLQRQYLRRQFALFCWVHISLLLIVVSSHFIVNNILEGLIWFFIPASLVICNDVMAYVCGKMFGKTPLIKLSPKKTMEGFVGAFLCTLIFGWAWSTFFMRFPYMICPARDLGTNVLSNVVCRPNPVFVWREYQITGPVRQILQTVLGRSAPSISWAPFQIHALVMATFASLVAPFGGFFASGFKRAFNIKDFGHSIPGHGGMTDRMDCQFMMGMFSYVYYASLIRIQYVDVGTLMQTIVTSLSTSEQLELLADMRRFLEGQGIKA
ncbi:cytidylyltransferase family-domain-containing protein [Dioszegia hungarica]|uniref:Phosphatidate cytidylyltransferase n=1 Tax=Dioszegia hungarica TaxID=4972 RepID=A0AA38H813_9TREE|nr:cytidylyltransferase family-domain-containing protein [Dioszegia hungarica]KAI9635343.1 cytidylyltransferase family-domain-containing protein [Dioszegia hungarica]